MEHFIDQLTPIALVTSFALLCGLAMLRLRQPAIVGYIVAGVVLGPTGLGLVSNTESVKLLAELGVIMLLFLIGMELSLRGFKSVYKVALLTTGLQIALLTGCFYLVGLWFDWSFDKVLVFGFVVAISSTAVAIKILEETGDLRTHVGRVTISILIAQDLAVIPLLLIINSLGGAAAGLWYIVVIKLLFAVGILAFLAWFLSRRERINLPGIEFIQSRKDIVPLAALAICFTFATISGGLGLSVAYGAFIAGLIIGNSNARALMHEATEPVQAILLMVFFLSIGLLIDLEFIYTNLGMVLTVLAVVTILKTAINIGILHMLGKPWDRAFQVGVTVAQVGEFSFILAAAALSRGVVSDDGYRLLVAVIALSLVISPLWLIIARRLHDIISLHIVRRDSLGEVVHAIMHPEEDARKSQGVTDMHGVAVSPSPDDTQKPI